MKCSSVRNCLFFIKLENMPRGYSVICSSISGNLLVGSNSSQALAEKGQVPCQFPSPNKNPQTLLLSFIVSWSLWGEGKEGHMGIMIRLFWVAPHQEPCQGFRVEAGALSRRHWTSANIHSPGPSGSYPRMAMLTELQVHHQWLPTQPPGTVEDKGGWSWTYQEF